MVTNKEILMNINKNIGAMEQHLKGINGFVNDQKDTNKYLWKQVDWIKAKIYIASGVIILLVFILNFLMK